MINIVCASSKACLWQVARCFLCGQQPARCPDTVCPRAVVLLLRAPLPCLFWCPALLVWRWAAKPPRLAGCRRLLCLWLWSLVCLRGTDDDPAHTAVRARVIPLARPLLLQAPCPARVPPLLRLELPACPSHPMQPGSAARSPACSINSSRRLSQQLCGTSQETRV